MASIPISRQIILNKKKEKNKPKPEPKEKPKIEPPTKYLNNRLEVVITHSAYWYVELEGSIFKVKQSACKTFFRTIEPVIRTAEYGIIKKEDCKII